MDAAGFKKWNLAMKVDCRMLETSFTVCLGA